MHMLLSKSTENCFFSSRLTLSIKNITLGGKFTGKKFGYTEVFCYFCYVVWR